MLLSEAIRKRLPFKCPCCGVEWPLLDIIDHLGDRHLWTTDHVADWVAEQEKRLGIAESARPEHPEHPERRAALERLAVACTAEFLHRSRDVPTSVRIALGELRSLEGK